MEFLIGYGYIGVFVAAFIAGSIFPFSSEVVLTGVLLAGSSYWPCMAAATLGNFMGGMTCYWFGMAGKTDWIRKYLKINENKLRTMQTQLKGKSAWVAFFAFVPVIGTCIVVALGLMRANVRITAISMLIGKALRYWIWMELVFKMQGLL
jgi:membrane protein YqaA with SNARE-associated domain